MQAVLLAIGDELTLGQTVDTNSAWLAAQLARLGIPTRYHLTLPDDAQAIAQAIAQAADDAELVIITGGLGPTEDDLTRQALAQALDQPLVLDEASLERIQQRFALRSVAMPPQNRIQAMHPRTTRMIPNDHGTAPGIRAQFKRATLYATPGVPGEMTRMFRQSIEPELRAVATHQGVILTATIHTFGQGESSVAQKLGPLMDRQRNPKVGTTVTNGVVSVRIRSEFSSAQEAQAQLDHTTAQVRERLGAIVYGQENQTLAQSLLDLLSAKDQHLATAESCTGGLLGKMITDVPGSSERYLGGWVTYSNAMKRDQLGVPESLLAAHGAVSEPVARAMAEGAIRHCPGATVSLAITGIAGPEGGTPEKPVGTVWVAMGWTAPAAPDRVQTEALLFRLMGDREAIRDWSAKCALQMLRLHLLGQPLELIAWAQRPATPAR
ncbi:MAG TPA: competence/damage-inducible protein A [Phycisphaeraceae bacterium]